MLWPAVLGRLSLSLYSNVWLKQETSKQVLFLVLVSPSSVALSPAVFVAQTVTESLTAAAAGGSICALLCVTGC